MWSPVAIPRSVSGTLHATTVGPEVADRLRGTDLRNGRGAAIFSSVFYLSLETGLLCVTRADVDPGPFSVMTSAPRHTDFRTFGLAVNQMAQLEDRRIVVSGWLEVDLSAAEQWSPDPCPEFPDPLLIARGLGRLRQCLPSDIIGTGLGGYLVEGYCAEDGDRVGLAAKAPILAAREFVAMVVSGKQSHCEWAKRLIGLGPGLTPSGDDFLGGLLIALHVLGAHDAARSLWTAIRADARAATNPISFAFLSAAAKGRGGASLHTTIAAIMTGDDPTAGLARLMRLGHSSGWDALVGVATVLEAFTRLRRDAAA